MGIIRLLLAIAVIITHSETLFGLHMTGGRIAVQAFYIVSGFYMALVLEEKYLKIQNGYRLFISNRFLRLYPAYWVVLLFTVGVSIAGGLIVGDYFKLSLYLQQNNLHWSSYAYLAVSNAGIFGQDLALFTGFDSSGVLHLMKNFRDSDPRVHEFLLIPQAWTISIELMFYLIAPFLVKLKSRMLFVLAVIAIALRIIAAMQGFDHDPWTHRFFPFELLFFIAGILSWRFYKKIELWSSLRTAGLVGMILFPVMILFFRQLSFTGFDWIFYALLTLALPGIFQITKNNKLDRYLGEYSYPIYIAHLTMLFIATKIIGKFHLPLSWSAELTFVITMVFCFVMIRFITNPIERYRARRVTDKQKDQSALLR